MTVLADEFRGIIEAAFERLSGIGEAQAHQPMPGGQWSAKQVLGHLIDSAANNHGRFVRAQFTDDLVLPGYEQEKWVEAQAYDEASWPALLELWRAYNLHLAHVVAGIPETTLTRLRSPHSLDQIAWQPVSPSEPASLEYLIRDYLGHLKDHLSQLYAAAERE